MIDGYIGEIVSRRFLEFGYSLHRDSSIIPKDNSTLFICSGMQQFRDRFVGEDCGKGSSLQSCIRTKDLELVGDGSHLTYFEMLGNFSFGRNDYEESVELWHLIINDLKIDITSIHCHPDRQDLAIMWQKRGYVVVYNPDCIWSDGDIKGECCEMFCGDLEIGNLVNPVGHSTDVGFGWERLHQVVEKKSRIDKTSLFIDHHPIVADHSRALTMMYCCDIYPSNKRRGYVCRRLIRRMLPFLRGDENFIFNEWIKREKDCREKNLRLGRHKWNKYKHKSQEWWWETFGILPEEFQTLSKTEEK